MRESPHDCFPWWISRCLHAVLIELESPRATGEASNDGWQLPYGDRPQVP